MDRAFSDNCDESFGRNRAKKEAKLSSPPDRLLTQLQTNGWVSVAGFSLLAINQLVDQLGIKPGEVIITRHGEVEVIYRAHEEGEPETVFEPVVPLLSGTVDRLHDLGIEFTDWKPTIYMRSPWWCPGCSQAYGATVDTNFSGPCCPRCGSALEQQGTGDDDPA